MMPALPGFETPGWLLLLPLAGLPWLLRRREALPNTWAATLPHDPASDVIGFVLHAAAALAIAALVLALAGPYRPEFSVERVGRGAEIVLVLDRSRSMDQGFAARPAGGVKGTGPEALDYYSRLRAAQNRSSKGQAARQLLGEFVARRPADRFGLVMFSTLPIRALGFTQKTEVVQAAIAAGNVGRGLSETNIGLALDAALGYFADRPYTGSRIVMLVSDGGDRLDPVVRERIAQQVEKHRVAIYWIYLRSAMSGSLAPGAGGLDDAPAADAEAAPETSLHRFFQSLGTPYRAYEADNPEALQKAIDDVDRLENLPIVYEDVVPRRSLAPWTLAAALAAVLLLLAAERWEIRRWA